MKTRLASIDPALDQDIKRLGLEEQRAMTAEILELLAARFDISNLAIEACVEYLKKQEKVPFDIRRKLEDLVEILDKRYFSLQKNLEHGNGNEEEVTRAFQLARFADAALFATRPDGYEALAETIYEASHALDGLEEIKDLLLKKDKGQDQAR